MKKVTIGIPAYKAEDHICDCLSSINIQSMRDEIEVIIAKDNPEDDYKFVIDRFPDLSITILDCEENTGPGLARQRCLDACTTDWVTFIDADDVFFTPMAIESLYEGIQKEVVEVQGTFLQEIEKNDMAPRLIPISDVGHPWVFGRMYRVKFLRDMKIGFSELRAMEDGEFNWKIRMSIEGVGFTINILDNPVYLWRQGSEHSITRMGQDENGIPQYNYDLCPIGATEAAIRAVNFCRKTNPFNGAITRFTLEQMVGQYFTYIECVEKRPVFADQNFFNAKKFYNECYKKIENQISDEILKDVYTLQYGTSGDKLLGIIPSITFFDFMDNVKSEEYRGEEEFKVIRSELPEEIIENDLKTGVLGRS